MNVMQIYELILPFAAALAFTVMLAQAYRMFMFRVMAEHRQEVIKLYTKLKDIPDLKDNEQIAMIRIIHGLYDRRMQASLLKKALNSLRHGQEPKDKAIREDVERMSNRFAAICLANHPILTALLVREVTRKVLDLKQRESKRSGPIARAERLVYLEVQMKDRPNLMGLAAC